MTADAGTAPAQPSSTESCLITSAKRRGTDSCSDIAALAKRARLPSAVDVRGSCTDLQRQQNQQQHNAQEEASLELSAPCRDQERQQQQQQQRAGDGVKSKSPLGHILTPVYYLLQQGSQQIAQHFGGVQQPQEQQEQQQQWSRARAVGGQPLNPEISSQAVHWRPSTSDAAAAGCATSTTSTMTGSVIAPDASNSVADGEGSGVPRPPSAPTAADSGCDTDADGEAAGGDQAVAEATAAAAGAASCPPPEAEDEDDEEWFDPLLFISRLPPEAPPGCARPGTLLPRRTRACKQKTLVLDLDETLVHSTLDDAPGSEGADFHFPVHFNGAEHMVHVRMRPHMRDFLERAAEMFEVVVFTASQKVYAEKLLNILDPTRRLIRHRIYRDSCVFWQGSFLKDLSGLGRDLAHTAIVDNSPQAFGFQVDNGIPIESWYDDEQDNELVQLMPLLIQLAKADDVRPVLRERFRMRERVQGAAATWRSRMEQEAMVAAAWQRQYINAVQQSQAAAQQAAAGTAMGAMMHQALPSLGQLRAAAATAAQMA